MAVGDIAQVRWRFLVGTENCENVFGFRQKHDNGTLANLASAFETALVKNTSGGLLYDKGTGVTSMGFLVESVYPGTQASHEQTYSEVAGGNAGSELLPPQCAMVITWKSDVAGRAYRGRTYDAGLLEEDQVAGVWQSGVITNRETFVTQMLAVFGNGGTDANWQFGTISRVLNGVERPTPIWTATTSGVVRPTVYNQTRRTVGRGS